MGGTFFSPELSTPRMPPAVYEGVKTRITDILSTFFTLVSVPTEAPEKTSYGDLDVLVSGPKEGYGEMQLEALVGLVEKALEAVKSVKEDQRWSMAIPWPEDMHSSSSESEAATESLSSPRYVQLDLSPLPHHAYAFKLFRNSHGDLWNILGSIIRPFNLTVNPNGLNLLHPTIAQTDKKLSLFPCTSDPTEILDFLGLLKSRSVAWEVPFGSVREMFEYACSSRFFTIEMWKDRVDTGQGLKNTERKRIGKRVHYTQFLTEYLPVCIAEGRYMRSVPSAEDVYAEAVEQFGLAEEIERRLLVVRKRRWGEALNNALRKNLPDWDAEKNVSVGNKTRMRAVRGLRREILEEGGWLERETQEKEWEDLLDVVKRLVIESWRDAAERERVREKAKAGTK